MKLLASLNIIDHDLAESALAYRDCRHAQHMLKLQGAAHLRVDIATVNTHMIAVKAL